MADLVCRQQNRRTLGQAASFRMVDGIRMWIGDDDFNAVSFYKETTAKGFGAGLVVPEDKSAAHP